MPTLETIGHALYGPQWQSEMSRALGVSDRTVRRWQARLYPMPQGYWVTLKDLLGKHSVECAKLAKTL